MKNTACSTMVNDSFRTEFGWTQPLYVWLCCSETALGWVENSIPPMMPVHTMAIYKYIEPTITASSMKPYSIKCLTRCSVSLHYSHKETIHALPDYHVLIAFARSGRSGARPPLQYSLINGDLRLSAKMSATGGTTFVAALWTVMRGTCT